MAFTRKNFSPVGDNARAGNVPQMFSYGSMDLRSAMIVPGYFNEMKGILRRGDWIHIMKDIDGAVPDLVIQFVTGDGQSPAVATISLDDGGTTTYVVGNKFTLTFTDGTVIQKPVFNIDAVDTGVITEISMDDPGLFDPNDPPTTLTALAVVDGGGSGATMDVTLATGEGYNSNITLSPLFIGTS